MITWLEIVTNVEPNQITKINKAIKTLRYYGNRLFEKIRKILLFHSLPPSPKKEKTI